MRRAFLKLIGASYDPWTGEALYISPVIEHVMAALAQRIMQDISEQEDHTGHRLH